MSITKEKLGELALAIFTHKRMKSFYWSAGTMGMAALIATFKEVSFDWPQILVLAGGLVGAQLTKWLNKKKAAADEQLQN